MKKLIALVASFLLLATAAFAGDHGKVGSISHDELKAAVNAGTVTLIDVNGSDTYKTGHIPGAIDFEANAASLAAKLPADKNALIVAYCGNEKCTAYKQGAEAAVKLGYTNVKHYSGGIAGWKDHGEKTEKAM